MKIKSLICTLIASLSVSVHAISSSLQHAEFGFDGEVIASELNDLGIKPSKALTTVYCQAIVSEIGATEDASCFNKEGNIALAGQVARAVSEQDFWPAHVSGRAVAVRVNFRVVLEERAQKFQAKVLPNLGALQNQYGPNYVEPQERLDSAGWYDYYTQRESADGVPFFAHKDSMVRVAATVALSGEVDRVDVLQADKGFRSEAKVVRTGLKKAKFIPGYVDGRPVAMPYLAVVSFD